MLAGSRLYDIFVNGYRALTKSKLRSLKLRATKKMLPISASLFGCGCYWFAQDYIKRAQFKRTIRDQMARGEQDNYLKHDPDCDYHHYYREQEADTKSVETLCNHGHENSVKHVLNNHSDAPHYHFVKRAYEDWKKQQLDLQEE